MKKINGIFNSHKKIIIPGLILIVIAFGGWKLFGKKTTAPQYQTAQAEKGTLINSISASGTISSGGVLNVSTNAGGTIDQLYVKNGDRVTKGQKIATILLDQDSLQRQTSAWSAYLQAKNQLASAKANINQLQAAAFKANQAFINGAVSRSLDVNDPTFIQENASWLQAEANYKNQAGVIAQSQSSLTSALYSYQQVSPTITAPATGIIGNLAIAPGLVITANTSSSSNTVNSQVIGTITTPQSHTQAVVNVSEIDITQVKPNQKVTLTLDAFPNKTFTGSVLLINTNGQVSSGVTNYPATIDFDTTVDNIYPNMAVTAKIIVNIKNDVLIAPNAAVQSNNGQNTVRILDNGKINTVNVEIGDSNSAQTEITSGLNEGETVITGTTAPVTSQTTQTTSPFSSFGGGNRNIGGAAVRRIGGD